MQNKFIIAFFIGVIAAVAFFIILKPIRPLKTEFVDENNSHKVLLIKTTEGAQIENLEKGARTAVSIVNTSSGILGKPLSLISINASDPKNSEELINSEIEKNKPLFMIVTAGNPLQAVKISNQRKIVSIVTGFGRLVTCIEDGNVSPYVWQTGMTPEMSVEPFLVFLADTLKPQKDRLRMFVFGNTDERTLGFTKYASEVARSLNIDIINDGYIDYRITDFFQYIRHIFGRVPDVLFIPSRNEPTMMFIKQALKLGIRSEMNVAGLIPFAEEDLNRYDNLSDGILTSTTYLPGTQSESNAKFFKAWKKVYTNTIPSSSAVDGYNPIIIAQAAYNSGKGDSLEAFTMGMKELDIKLPQGRFLIDSSNHTATQPLFAVTIKNKAFEHKEHLGPVSHPKFEGCVINTEK